ncbi:MAG: alpha/beta hydrolase [Eubacterium sp.]|nr:alpha/beta hydrolase [Eubacterium sp.]
MNNYLINSKETVKTNHQQYPIRLLSNRPDGPIFLFLHGGPGMPDAELVLHYQQELAEYGTLVTFDQRGAGDAYSLSFAFKKNLMKERLLSDIDNLVTYLLRRFQKEKVVLCGHSFGSVLSVWYAQQHPEKVACLVNAAQLAEAERPHRYSSEELFTGAKTLLPVALPAIRSRGFSGLVKLAVGAKWSANSPLAKEDPDLLHTAAVLAMPVYIVMGTNDSVTPLEPAKAWFDALTAPDKAFCTVEGAGHPVMFEKPAEYNALIKEFLGLH